jgi:hypothetical protein
MKPSIVIKTKGGRRYLQIKTIDGALIDLGLASVLKNRQVASLALDNEYNALHNRKNRIRSSHNGRNPPAMKLL